MDLMRRVITQKLRKNPETLLYKTKREQQKQLQETAKEFINSFDNLSNQYFKKVGDEYLMAEFSELISEHMIKELAATYAKNQEKAAKEAEQQTAPKREGIYANMLLGGKKSQSTQKMPVVPNILRSNSSNVSGAAVAPVSKNKKDDTPVEHPLASIKSQIGNIEEFINSLLETDKELENRKQEILKIEDEKKKLIYEIFNLKSEIVPKSNLDQSQ